MWINHQVPANIRLLYTIQCFVKLITSSVPCIVKLFTQALEPPQARQESEHSNRLSLYTQLLLHNQQHGSSLQCDWPTAAAAATASSAPPSGVTFTNRATNIKQHILNWQSKQSNRLKQTSEMDSSSKTTSNTYKNDDNPCNINKYRTYKHSHVVLTMATTE